MTSLLLGLDFDGTLAPINIDPEAVEIDPGVRKMLVDLGEDDRVALAIVSGRDLDDLRSRTEGLNAWRSGAHGRELESPAGEVLESMEPLEEMPSQEWFDEVRGAGMRVERKRYGVALHWRGIDDVDENHPLVSELKKWGRARQLHESPGRSVLEVARGEAGKLAVMKKLKKTVSARRVVYAGDDLTDFPSIEWAATEGTGIFVRSSERSQSPMGAVTVEDLAGLKTKLMEILREL